MADVVTRPMSEVDRLAWYRKMRDTEPVWREPSTGAWHVFRYADVTRLLGDHRTFGSDFSAVMPERKDMLEGNILAMDPPRHHRVRALVSRAFSPQAIARLEGRVAAVTEELLDGVAGRDSIELVDALAYPLPVTVIAEMLGVPAADRPRFKEWADALLSQNGDADDKAMAKVERDMNRFRDYLREHVGRRRVEPRHDLLSDLVGAEIDGERLGDGEIVGFATVLLLAGHITTTALLVNAVRCLDEHPEAQDALRADPARLPAAIEEVLRFRSPFAQTARVTRVDAQLGDRVIPAGQLISAWLLAANRDERAFERPDDLVIDRSPNRHVGFGGGIHFCLGAPLARLEGRVALSIVLRRYSSLRVDRDAPMEPYPDPGINSLRSLRVLVEPAR